ncbi:hypothetical protein GCM10010206_30060 [Streptomyces cinerochromogenes]|nr:hypothetical protein GCM10010206_30060 [Streptomyces cinerochromogenes]
MDPRTPESRARLVAFRPWPPRSVRSVRSDVPPGAGLPGAGVRSGPVRKGPGGTDEDGNGHG